MRTEAELAIIGAGPAGLAAFIQARRQGLLPLVVEENQPGGALRAGRRIENYPGVEPCSGMDLAARMTAHAEAMGLEILHGRVESLQASGTWQLSFKSGRELPARAVIVATGQTPVLPASLKPLQDAGALLWPGTFDPAEWQSRRVLVLGGGDVAFDQALLLLDHSAVPRIVCRSRPRALPALQEEARARGLDVACGWEPVASSGGPPATVGFRGARDPRLRLEADADIALAATGRRPAPPALFGTRGERIGSDGEIPDLPGLFWAGDARRGELRQASIAAGDGCAAAIEAWKYLEVLSRKC